MSITSSSVHAVPNYVLNKLKANAEPTNIMPNPEALRIYNRNYYPASANIPNDSWGGSLFYLPTSPTKNYSSGNGFKMLLKNETSSWINKIVVQAYFKTMQEALNAKYEVRVEENSCGFSAPFNPANIPKLRFQINGVQRYSQNATVGNSDDVCKPGSSNFEGVYQSVGAPRENAATGLFVSELEFFLGGDRYGDISTGPQDDNQTGRNQIRFQVRATSQVVVGGSTVASEVKLGLNRNTAATDFGVAESYGTERFGLATGMPFGLACSESDAIAPARVNVYDGDLSGFGSSYVYILKRQQGTGNTWQKLDGEEYTRHFYPDPDFRPVLAVWEEANLRWRLIAENRVTSSIFIKANSTVSNYKQGWDYMLVFDNPSYVGKRNPTGNVLSFSVPGESINVGINCDYDLEPQVSKDTSTYAYYPDIRVTGGVDNNSDSVVAPEHAWETIVARYSSAPPLASPGDRNDLNQCNVLPPANRLASSCQKIMNSTYPATPSLPTQYTGGGPDQPGTHLCFITRVQKPTPGSADDVWRYSDMVCAISSKNPKVHILGTDLKVGGSISTSVTRTKASDGEFRTFGSWVEYGVFSTETNVVASSGSGLRDGKTESLSSAWSYLTFANTTSPAYGSYGNLVMPNARSWFAGLTSPPGNTLDGVAQALPNDSGVYRYDGGGTITIDQSTIAAGGKSIIIQAPNGTVRLTGSGINVPNTGRTSVRDISQVVIVAKNISIDSTVTKIDAWLLAIGNINTCGDQAPNPATVLLTDGMCTAQLEVNGAVSVDKLYLMRTAKADAANPEAPAEIFRLRPDAQLWAYNYANGGDRAQTTYLKELPPRF